MTMNVKKTKIISFIAVSAAVTTLMTGCKQEAKPEPVVEIAPPAETAVETAPADLAQQAADLFEQPLQPNPLAMSAEDVVITVDGEEITHGEIMQGVQMNIQQLSRRGMSPQQLAQMGGQMYQNVADSLVANILLTKAAEQSSLTVSDAELAEQIAEIEANAPEGSSLKDVLAENNIDYADWEKDMRKQMLVQKFVEEKTADTPEVTAAELTQFYEENADSFKVPESISASHILIAFDKDETDATKAEKKKKIDAIHDELLGGADFAAIAAEKSDCPSSKQGGDLGTFTHGQMVPEFENAAFSQEVGAVGDVVETKFGYHIIKVTDHKDAGIRSLAEVKEQLTKYLQGKKKQDALMAYIDELKAKATIVNLKPDFDAASKTPAAE